MIAMKYYTSTTEFNCGIDLHARQMYVCVMDRDGKKLVHTNIRNNDFEFFLKLVGPYRHDLTVCCECMFGRYFRWAFGEAAVVAKRDAVLGPLAQRLEARMGGNKFKATTVLAIKLARAVYFMLKNKTAFDPERLVAALSKN